MHPIFTASVVSRLRTLSQPATRRWFSRTQPFVQLQRSHKYRLPLVLGLGLAISSAFAWHSAQTIHLDSDLTPQLAVVGSEELTVDPATSISFPNTLRIPSRTPLPTFSLVGVGVRTVSFLGLKVYSVGFYADLNSPKLNIPKDATAEEKIEHIVRNAGCVLRIIPTRATSYSHLRDGLMRTLQARVLLCRKNGMLTPGEELEIQPPLRKFKSLFPNTAFAKHMPMDILLTPPESSQPRTLIIRDLGSVQSDWLSREFFLAYFEGDGLSPPLKTSVVERLQTFEK